MSNSSLPSNHPLLVLLDLVDAPLMMFTPDGRVAFANRAAKTLPARPVLSLPGDPQIRALVAALSQGQTVASPTIEVEVNADEGALRLRCTCAPKPIAGLLAMSVVELTPPPATATANASTQPEAPAQRLTLQEIMGLIQSDLGPSIQLALQSPTPETIGAFKERLDRLSDLVDLFGEDVLIGEERVLVPDAVREICQSLAPLAQEQRVQFSLQAGSEELPPVYGSRKLLHRAIYECLHNAVMHSGPPKGTQFSVVGVHMRASGYHLLVSVRNLGVVPAAVLAKQASQLFRPSPDTQPAAAAQDPKLQIGLPLIQRILQLHGGRLKVENEQGELDVQLEIPTGAPLRNTHHLDLLQAQIYAEDLSTLMARSRQRSPA